MSSHKFCGCITYGATIRAVIAVPISIRENGQKMGWAAKVSEIVV